LIFIGQDKLLTNHKSRYFMFCLERPWLVIEIHGSKLSFYRKIFLWQYCVKKCLVLRGPKEVVYNITGTSYYIIELYKRSNLTKDRIRKPFFYHLGLKMQLSIFTVNYSFPILFTPSGGQLYDWVVFFFSRECLMQRFSTFFRLTEPLLW